MNAETGDPFETREMINSTTYGCRRKHTTTIYCDNNHIITPYLKKKLGKHFDLIQKRPPFVTLCLYIYRGYYSCIITRLNKFLVFKYFLSLVFILFLSQFMYV
jgi:hypothetical protein